MRVGWNVVLRVCAALLLCSGSSYAQNERLHIRNFNLFGDSAGWVLTDAALLRTDDDGRTWRDVTPASVTARAIGGVVFTDRNHG